jgi:hypothetical protein
MKFLAIIFSSLNAFSQINYTCYAAEIDSLYYVDQVIIRNRPVTDKRYKIDLYVYAKDRPKYDSISFRYLLKLIDKYGFPSEKKLGKRVYDEAALIIHHSIRMPYFRKELESFKKYVLIKEYKPEDFAWAFDQSNVMINNSAFYFYKVGQASKLSDMEKKEVNKRRKEIGLHPLEKDVDPR